MASGHTKRTGYGRTELTEDQVIFTRLGGYVGIEITNKVMAQTKTYVDELRTQGKPVKLLLDVTRVTGQDSASRSAAKTLKDFGLDRFAIFGANRAVSMVAQYLIRAAGMGEYTKVFRTRKQAEQWLRGVKSKRARISLALLGALLGTALVLASAAIVGWAWNQPALTTLGTRFNAMNPVTAFILLAAVAATIAAALGWVRAARLGAVVIGVYAALVASRYLWGWDTGVDTWLFRGELQADPLGRTSVMTSVVAIIGSVLLFIMSYPTYPLWRKVLFRILHAAALLLLLVVIFGYGFDIAGLYTLATPVPIPLNTAVAFLCIQVAFFFIDTKVQLFAPARKVLQVYWAAIFVFLALLLLTGFVWRLASGTIDATHANAVEHRFEDTEHAIRDHMDAYVNALHGFKAFIESSSAVSPEEFKHYFEASGLSDNYPGFSAITFVRSIPANRQADILKEIRSYPGYGSFALRPNVPGDEHYAVVYVQPATPATTYGTDLANDPVRLQALRTARDTGEPAATASITLNATGTNPNPSQGFFITIPVYKGVLSAASTVSQRREQHIGFVNAVFRNDLLFPDLFERNQEGVVFTVVNQDDNAVLHQTASAILMPRQASAAVPVATQNWRLTMYADESFGITGASRHLPLIALTSGFALTLLGTFAAGSQVRRRRQAVELAAHMTEDLNNERNSALALQQKDEAILSSIGDAVFAIDKQQHITLFNPAAQQISGWSDTEAIGKPYKDVLKFIDAKTGAPSQAFVGRALAGHLSSMKAQTLLVRRDGTKVPVSDSAAPIRSGAGEIQGAIIVFRDISKEYELDQAKTEFVSLASHQLRTPLAAINWYVEMLLAGDAGRLTKGQKEQAQAIHDGNRRMVELVNSLLDVSRLDLGKLTNEPAPTSMAELAESLHQELASSIATKKLQYQAVIEPKLPPVVADPKLLRMILQNLLSNAVKYTPEKGSVSLTMRRGEAAGKPQLLLTVSDTGFGIPKAQQGKIFGKLFRADNVRAMDVEGTGLGLYIVKQVVEKLGGSIHFESAERQGTTFHVSLPFQTAHKHTPPAQEGKERHA